MRASRLPDFNVRQPTLKVNSGGRALVEYTTVRGMRRHVLVWGAVNARVPPRATSARCASGSTSPVAGGSRASRSGGRFETHAARTTGRAFVPRRGVQGTRRLVLGAPVVAAEAAAARVPAVASRARRLRAPRLPLEHRAARARGVRQLDVRAPVAGRLRPALVPRAPVTGSRALLRGTPATATAGTSTSTR